MRGTKTLVLAVALAVCGSGMLPLQTAEAAPLGQSKSRAERNVRVDARGARPVIWRDPGRVERLDFQWGPGGRANAPVPPFRFVEEDDDGSNAKVKVRDARGRQWTVKWDTGGEANAEIIATRVAWAAGYFVEPTYLVRSGRIHGAGKLGRAKKFVAPDGRFRDGRFELKYPTVAKLDDRDGWTWKSNPFVGTREFNGLKIVTMLVSNWDNKDARDASRGSNTAVHVVRGPRGLEARYLVTDWGGTMGKWGNFLTREKWDCEGFAYQTAKFVRIENDGSLDWGFSGQHSGDFKKDIGYDDVRWVMQYLGRITDRQLRDGLVASGASPAEVRCYQTALRARIEQLRSVATRAGLASSRR